MSEFEIRPIKSFETHLLRRDILRPGTTLDDVVFTGDDDTPTLHAGAFLGPALVGIASIYQVSPPFDSSDVNAWQIRGMAVVDAVRKRSVGRWLLALTMQHASEHGATRVWCNARTSAMGFYERLGFEVEGGEFEIPEIGSHFIMWRSLT